MKKGIALLLFVSVAIISFSSGSKAQYSCYAKDSKAKFIKAEMQNTFTKYFCNDVFVNDAAVIEIPANYIGFHSFAYSLCAGKKEVILPVANAPPNS